MSMPVTAECFAAHLGPYAILPDFLKSAVSAIRSGMWQGVGGGAVQAKARQPVSASPVIDQASGDLMYLLTPEGVAVMELTGGMMKGRSKFGGVSTVAARANIRAAVGNDAVKSILLVIDSPGGTVSGTQSLADEIRSADSKKPVIAHIEDMGASAAYWIASQARRVSANRSAMVGSLGTFGVVEDSSGKAAAEGVVVHVLSTGPHKGAFVEGAPVTEAQLADYQKLIDQLNAQFMEAVATGRRMPMEQTAKLFDGRVHVASTAQSLGLLDSVESLTWPWPKR